MMIESDEEEKEILEDQMSILKGVDVNNNFSVSSLGDGSSSTNQTSEKVEIKKV